MISQDVIWSPDMSHFAVVSQVDSGTFTVFMFDKSGSWVGQAPGREAAWANNQELLVLPVAMDRGFLSTAFIATVGYNDEKTMSALPGRYSHLLGGANGTVSLMTESAYAIWRSGTLQKQRPGEVLAISPDGSLLAVDGVAGLRVEKASDGQVVRSWPEVRLGRYPTASFSQDQSHLVMTDVVGSKDALDVLTIRDGSATGLLAGSVAYGPTWLADQRIFAGDSAGSWWLISLDGKQTKMATIQPTARAAAISPDGAKWAAIDENGKLVIEGSGGALNLDTPPGPSRLYWSPDGTELVVVGGSKVAVFRP